MSDRRYTEEQKAEGLRFGAWLVLGFMVLVGAVTVFVIWMLAR